MSVEINVFKFTYDSASSTGTYDVLQKHKCAIHVQSSIKVYKHTWLLKVQESVMYWHLESDVHIFSTAWINTLIGWKKRCLELIQFNNFLQKLSTQDVCG